MQTRDQQGLIRTIAKFKDPIGQEVVESKYGPGYYCLKQTSPRFNVIWKGWVGKSVERNDLVKRQSREIQSLKKKSSYLAWGEVILGVGEVVGFGLTASNLIDHGKRLNRVESVVSAINAQNPAAFVCPKCLQRLPNPLDAYCANCGDKLDWSTARSQNIEGALLCSNCFNTVRRGQNFCTRCGRALVSQNGESTTLQFAPLRRGGLP